MTDETINIKKDENKNDLREKASDASGNVQNNGAVGGPVGVLQKTVEKKRFSGIKKGERTHGNKRSRSGARHGKERARSEFDNKVIGMRRVTRVVAGGRRFSFSVALVIGDKKGSVGVGVGKASDTALAIEKATRSAKKNMIKIRTTKDMSIPHDVSAKYASSVVALRPAPGRGLVAGGAVRAVLNMAGVHNVGAKILSRSKNPTNNARATISALGKLLLKKNRVGQTVEEKAVTQSIIQSSDVVAPRQ